MLKQKKKIILATLGILATLSVGYIVNSSNLGGGSKKNEYYSEALNYTFTKDGSDFDGISTNYKYYTGTTPNEDAEIIEHSLLQEPNQPPWKQFWDGFEPSNSKYKKEDYTLVVKDLKIKKVSGSERPIEGIQFCQVQENKENNEINKIVNCGPNNNWITNKLGEVTIPINELNPGESYLIERIKTQQGGVKIDEQKVNLKDDSLQKEMPIYVDYGVRFLGEVKGKEEGQNGKDIFITYETLIKQITADGSDIGNKLYLGNDTSTGGNWLKIYDVQKSKILYVAKKPLTNIVSWDMLYNAGVVYGPEFINTKLGDLNIGKIKSKEELDKIGPEIYQNFKNIEKQNQKEYNAKIINIKGKRYLVRLLKGTSRIDPNQVKNIGNFYKNENFRQSDWNRYILPFIKYHYGYEYIANKEECDEQNGFYMGLINYNWFGDLTLGSMERFKYNGAEKCCWGEVGQRNWVQEYTTNKNYRVLRGSEKQTHKAAQARFGDNTSSRDDVVGFRPVLEEIN